MSHILTLYLPIAVLLGSAGVSWSADFQKGLTAAQSGDFATALREWTPFAEQGIADAQYNLGQMYRNGQGVPQDYKTAVKWYTATSPRSPPWARCLPVSWRWRPSESSRCQRESWRRPSATRFRRSKTRKRGEGGGAPGQEARATPKLAITSTYRPPDSRSRELKNSPMFAKLCHICYIASPDRETMR